MSKLAPKTRPGITLVVWIDNAKPFSNLCFLEVLDQYMIIIVHVPSRSVLVVAVFGFILSENSFATTPLASLFSVNLPGFFMIFPAVHKIPGTTQGYLSYTGSANAAITRHGLTTRLNSKKCPANSHFVESTSRAALRCQG